MNTRDVLLLILDVAKIRGNTAIQKIAYFISIKLGIDMNFFPHYYGPYSRNVALELQNLVDFNFVDDNIKFTKRNRIMHEYTLNDDGKKIVSVLKNKYKEEYEVIREIIKNIEDIFGQNYNILSWAAKIHFILKERGIPISEEEIINLAKGYDWNLSDEEIESAKKLLLALKLVRITKVRRS